MPAHGPQLFGVWSKTAVSDCGRVYPDVVRFEENGLYYAQNKGHGMFMWDVGTFEIVGTGRVRISLANDAIVEYRFETSDGALTFVDPDGCEFSYRKEEL